MDRRAPCSLAPSRRLLPLVRRVARRWLVAAALGLASMAAPAVAAPPGEGGPCERSEDCATGLACINQTCVDLCTSDSDCAAGFACVTGSCRASDASAMPQPPAPAPAPVPAPRSAPPSRVEPPTRAPSAPPRRDGSHVSPAPGRRSLPKPPGYRQHNGFMLRLQTGADFVKMKSDTDPSFTLDGVGQAFRLGLGAGFGEGSFILFDVFGALANDPTISMDSQSVTAKNSSLSWRAFSLGIGHYFPSNVFIGGALSRFDSTLTLDGFDPARTEMGFGVNFNIGKEWWIGGAWGLGAVANFFIGEMHDTPDVDAVSWQVTSFTLAVSATLN